MNPTAEIGATSTRTAYSRAQKEEHIPTGMDKSQQQWRPPGTRRQPYRRKPKSVAAAVLLFLPTKESLVFDTSTSSCISFLKHVLLLLFIIREWAPR
jgi:hypothetical protein